jgi:hypothetical protein
MAWTPADVKAVAAAVGVQLELRQAQELAMVLSGHAVWMRPPCRPCAPPARRFFLPVEGTVIE